MNAVLKQIGGSDLPLVQVYNKADILGVPPRVDRAETGMPMRVWLSAKTGEGLDALLGVITDYLHADLLVGTVRLSVSQARLRALLYDSAAVIDERVLADGGWELDLEIDRKGFQFLQQTEDLHFQTDRHASDHQ